MSAIAVQSGTYNTELHPRLLPECERPRALRRPRARAKPAGGRRRARARCVSERPRDCESRGVRPRSLLARRGMRASWRASAPSRRGEVTGAASWRRRRRARRRACASSSAQMARVRVSNMHGAACSAPPPRCRGASDSRRRTANPAHLAPLASRAALPADAAPRLPHAHVKPGERARAERERVADLVRVERVQRRARRRVRVRDEVEERRRGVGRLRGRGARVRDAACESGRARVRERPRGGAQPVCSEGGRARGTHRGRLRPCARTSFPS